MAIDPLSASRAYLDAARAAQRAPKVTGKEPMDFGTMVQNAVATAVESTQSAERMGLAAAAGRADIVDVVTAVAAAETQLETVMAVRDQVITAYQEILRMPI